MGEEGVGSEFRLSGYLLIFRKLSSKMSASAPAAVFAASVFNGFQGLVSHFNVDSRAGWFNRLFIGTELHRFHHSANLDEAKNYAATFSIWDQLFGTYRLPGCKPEAIDIIDRVNYPADTEWTKILCFPLLSRFKKE